MHDKHEPRPEFVEGLEWQIGSEVRRRNRSAEAGRWTPRSRMKAALAVMGLMLVSMGIGAAATAAAYQAQGNELRDLLTSSFERRAEVARQRLMAATKQQEVTERQVSLGTAIQLGLLEDRVKVAEAQAQLRSIELQIEEIRITRREPRDEVSSPLVSGRDFVSERLKAEYAVPEAARELEKLRLRETEKRLSLGTADILDVDAARVRTGEVEAAINALQEKLKLRDWFLGGKINAMDTELTVAEIEAEQRQKTLAPKVGLARKQLERTKSKVQLGTAQRVDVAEATLRLQELETEMARCELELALVRRQLEQRRTGR